MNGWRTAIPRLGLGTWGRTGDAGLRDILAAIELGYRHLDTAQTYDTEAIIGQALRLSGVPRAEMFLTTKVADTRLARRDFLPSLHGSLERLGVEQVDLTLIHWPAVRDSVPLAEYLEALADAKAQRLTRLIGVSNFPSALIERAVEFLGPGQIATNQVEVHPYLQNRRLCSACERQRIVVTAYMPLARGKVTRDPQITRVAAELGETAATVTLAWLLQRGLSVIPAACTREHLSANLRALHLRLEPAAIAVMDALDAGERLVNPDKSPAWD